MSKEEKEVSEEFDTGHWSVVPDDFTNDTFGFVYVITNTVSGRKYIGCKQCKKRVKLKPLKGMKRKRIKIYDSDWRKYTGSSTDLNNDIEELGKDKFHFEILNSCDGKWELAYTEGKLQFEKDALLSDVYYNGIINLRISTVPKLYREKYAKSQTKA
tara:strand:- start:27293 stop:27763 length:471 start_codon:yes stop_codon:yes gene_type:complete